MKLLFASQGKDLDSLLSRNPEKAEWYLIVDSATHDVTPVRSMAQPLQDVLTAAFRHGVRAFITGSTSEHSQITISADLTTVSFAQEITVEGALERWETGQLQLVCDEHPSFRDPEKVHIGRVGKKIHSYDVRCRKSDIARIVTPRGRHHIQQYAGRGH